MLPSILAWKEFIVRLTSTGNTIIIKAELAIPAARGLCIQTPGAELAATVSVLYISDTIKASPKLLTPCDVCLNYTFLFYFGSE